MIYIGSTIISYRNWLETGILQNPAGTLNTKSEMQNVKKIEATELTCE